MPRDFFMLDSQAGIGQAFRHPVVTQEEVRRFRLALIGYFNAAGRQKRQAPDRASQGPWDRAGSVARSGALHSPAAPFLARSQEGGPR